MDMPFEWELSTLIKIIQQKLCLHRLFSTLLQILLDQMNVYAHILEN